MIEENKRFIGTCAAGLEGLLQGELASIGALTPAKFRAGGVSFEGPLEIAYRACLWSRFGSRILYPLGEFPARDAEELYLAAREIDWPSHFSPDATFSVGCTADSSIRHSHFAALRVKDAVADQFRDRFQRRPSVRLERPDVRIQVHLEGGSAIISLDLSGESLHRRGYRTAGGEAPLKESLAAAVLRLSGWTGEIAKETTLLDPMCGSGTLLIEAAWMYGDIAPGLLRGYFGFLGWQFHDAPLWERLLSEARERKSRGMGRPWPKIVGYDAVRSTINEAVDHIAQAGLRGFVHVERRDLASLDGPLPFRKGGREEEPGMIVVNPPYGERLGSRSRIRYLYRCLGRKMRRGFEGWRAGVLAGHQELAEELRMEPSERFRLYNGTLPCELRVFRIPPLPEGRGAPGRHAAGAVPAGGSEDLANRLRKNFKRLEKWVEREGVTCYRLYDRDIPEYAVTVDLYGPWVHVQEYAPPKTVDPEKAAKRLREVVRTIEGVLDVGRDRIYVKVKARQKGKSQYQKRDERGRLAEVREGNCRFLVNLSDYLDTGLFLDHRKTRALLQEAARGSRFLNLFGYTGTATVHAAMGGAKSSVTVDTSSVYLDWAGSNLALNGFSESNHRLVQADCSEWLSMTKGQFDLIFVDPPTFSNARHTKRVFDVQRDHTDLIRSAMKRLEHDGALIFSTNFRRFGMDPELSSDFLVEEISALTIPPDFERNPRVHRCWRFQRRSKVSPDR